MKKPVFEKGNADWISELQFVIRKYNTTINSSIKRCPIQASLKKNKKSIFESSR